PTAGHGADVKNVPARLHPLHHPVRGCHHVRQIGVDDIADLLDIGVTHTVRRKAGVDHRDVDAAQILGTLLDEAVDVFLLREVDVDAIAFAHLADAFERIVEMFGRAPADEDLHAFAGQQDRNGAAYPGRAAGDDRLAPSQ